MSQDLQIKWETPSEVGLILVVEDDPRMQKVLRRILTAQDCAVVVAGDGKQVWSSFNHVNRKPLCWICFCRRSQEENCASQSG